MGILAYAAHMPAKASESDGRLQACQSAVQAGIGVVTLRVCDELLQSLLLLVLLLLVLVLLELSPSCCS